MKSVKQNKAIKENNRGSTSFFKMTTDIYNSTPPSADSLMENQQVDSIK